VKSLLPLLIRFLKHNLVGLQGLLWKMIVMVLFKEVLKAGYLLSTVCAVEVVLLHNFFWHQHWTWKDRSEGLTFYLLLFRLMRYHFCTGLTAMVVNLGMMRLLVGALGVHYLPALLLATGFSGTLNFLMAALVIFLPVQKKPAI
jgi:putative flippase GtrA